MKCIFFGGKAHHKVIEIDNLRFAKIVHVPVERKEVVEIEEPTSESYIYAGTCEILDMQVGLFALNVDLSSCLKELRDFNNFVKLINEVTK